MLFFIINSTGFLYFEWSPNAVLASNFIGVFVISLSYHGKWRYRIIASFLVVVLLVLFENLCYYLVIYLGVEHVVTITVAVSDFLLLMMVLILQKAMGIHLGEDILILEWLAILLIPMGSIVMSILVLEKCRDESAIVIGEGGLITLNILVFYLLSRITELYQRRSQMSALENQIKAYEKQIQILTDSAENIAALRHDMKTHIMVLQNISKEGSKGEVREYLDKILDFVEPDNCFVSTGNYAIDGIVNLKLGELQDRLGSQLNYDVFVPGIDRIDKMDISIILGNLFDNAIQALEKCEKDRSFNFFMEKDRGLLLIKMKNSHQEKIHERDGNFYTTKPQKRNHGIGLKNVKQIVERYNGDLNINYDENYFSIEVLLYLDEV